jgi:hypothetical protein
MEGRFLRENDMNAILKEEFHALENAHNLDRSAPAAHALHPHELQDILLNRRFGSNTNPWWTPSQVKPWDSRPWPLLPGERRGGCPKRGVQDAAQKSPAAASH